MKSPTKATSGIHRVSRFADYLYTSRSEASTEFIDSVERLGRRIKRSGHVGEDVNRCWDTSNEFARGMFSVLYEDAPKTGSDPLLDKLHNNFDSSSGFDELKEQTLNDPDMSALATEQFVRSIDSTILGSANSESKSARVGRGGASIDVGSAKARIAIRAAMKKAQEKVNEAVVALNGLKPGLGSTPPASSHESTTRYEISRRIMDSDKIKKIMKLAGRMRRLSDSAQMSKDPHSRTTMVGIETGNDLPRLLPTELCMLGMNSLKVVQLAKFAERKMLQYKAEGTAPLGRGPLTILLDVSGSMDGSPMEWACAITIACITIAEREKRCITVVPFTQRIGEVYKLDASGEFTIGKGSAYREVKGGIVEMALAVATLCAGGGTSFQAPFDYAIEHADGLKHDRADLLLITDGHASCSPSTIDKMNQLVKKEAESRIFAMTVNGGSLGSSISDLCEQVIDFDAAIRSGDAAGVVDALPR